MENFKTKNILNTLLFLLPSLPCGYGVSLLLIMFLLPGLVMAQHKGINFQAVIKKPGGTYPTVSGLTVTLQILDPVNGCVLREEIHAGKNISNGYLNLVIGDANASTPAGKNPSPVLTIQEVMDNKTQRTGLNCVDVNDNIIASAQTYIPSNLDRRILRVRLNIQGDDVVADFNMRAVAFAVNSEMLNSKTDTDFVNINSAKGITKENVESIFERFTKLDALLNNTNGTGTNLGINITGNAATATNVTGTVGIANGGTGANSVEGARTNLGLGPLATMTPTGTASTATYLRGDGAWVSVNGGVSSVAGKGGDVTLEAADISDLNGAVDARIANQKGQNNGLATLNASGKVPSTQLSLTSADVPALDWSKVTTGKPTTLGGYGITDAVVNGGNTGKITSGLDGSKPGTPASGEIFVATDVKKIYRWSGSAWDVLSTGAATGTITSLTGDVTASGTGPVAATVAQVGGVTAANVASGANAANAATNANTVSTIVKRDASGNFSAGTITATTFVGNLTGSASNNVLKSGDTMTGALTINAANEVRFADTDSSNYVGFKSAGTVSANKIWTLPAADGSANQVLKTDGAGNLGWATASTGSVTNVSSANTDIGVATGASTPVLTLNSGTAGGAGDANKIAKLDASGLLPVNMIPAQDASKITSGTLPVARGGTNSSTALMNNRIMTSSGDAIVEGAAILANKALISDVNGIPTHSTVSGTELGYLSGVGSAIQTQLDGKASASGWANYSVIGSNSSGVMNAITGTVNGSVLQYSATGPAYSTASYPVTTSINQLLYSSNNNVVGGLPTSNDAILTTNGSGVPGWSALSNDVFTQYVLHGGRSGGQIINGGTEAGNDLTLQSTSHTTKGNVLLNPDGGNVGIGTTSPGASLEVAGQVKITGGSPGAGKVLTSDASGLAAWVTPAASGVTSLNGLTAGVQTFAVDASGTAPVFNSSGSTHTLSIPMASTSGVTAGLLSKAEYDSFAGKFSATVTSPATGQVLRYNGASWVNAVINAASDLSGLVSVANGGTGASSLGSGNILIGGGTGAVTSLASGASGNVVYGTGLAGWASGTPDAAGLVDKISTQTISGAKAFTNYIQMAAQNQIRFADGDSSNYVSLRSPATVGSNVELTLPINVGLEGQALLTDGSGNLSWGAPTPGALNDLTDVYVDSVNASLFMGPETMQTGSTGNNVGIGIRSLGALTTGSENVALGVDAMSTNTTGYANTALGYDSLYSNTTGANNIAIGSDSLWGNIDGGDNTAIGTYTLANNTSGSKNIGLGSSALGKTTTGLSNIGIGYTAGWYNQTGSNNIAIGTSAGRGSSGVSNFNNIMALGFEAGKALRTGGDNNILIGYRAGDQITTGAKNIVIGHDIDTPTVTTTNSLNIGNLIYGIDIDGTGTTLSSGKVGIGVSSPTAKLHVQGTTGATIGYFSDGTQSCSITPSVAGNISCSSDERLKKDVRIYDDISSLEKILKLQTVTYKWKNVDNGRHTGYIAQDVEKVAPEFVRNGSDGYKQVSYAGLIPWITGAIKALYVDIVDVKKESEVLQDQVEILKQENLNLKARLERLEQTMAESRKNEAE